MNYISLIKACEDAWQQIQSYHPEVPDTVVIVASGGTKAAQLYGHFAKDSWEVDGETINEVLIVAEQLHRGAEEVFRTLIHEAVHGLAHARSIKDCSAKRHNKKFAYLAEEMHLEPPEKPDLRLGFSDVQLSDSARYMYADSIKQIEDSLNMFRKLKLNKKEVQKNSWSAECHCPRKIRVGKKIYDGQNTDIGIKCVECDSNFEVEPD